MNLPFFALRRAMTLTLAMLLAFALAACASDDGGNGGDGGDGGTDESVAASADAGGGSGTATVEGGSVEITAENLEFDANTIEAPAGETWTITLVNNDSAPHNISIYTEEGGEEIVIGDVINGGETVEVEVPALDAGEYFFVCDVHPTEMTGTVVVG
jgi:plastocyanin